VRRYLLFSEVHSISDSYVAFIPDHVADEGEFQKLLAERLSFPEEFRKHLNWNAIRDHLADFHWVKEKNIVLIHHNIPRISDAALQIYIDLLEEAVGVWEKDEEHSLLVIFPSKFGSERKAANL
jgi:hypothetical protein